MQSVWKAAAVLGSHIPELSLFSAGGAGYLSMKLADLFDLLPITTVNRLIVSCSGTIEDFDFDYRQFEAPRHGKPSKSSQN